MSDLAREKHLSAGKLVCFYTSGDDFFYLRLLFSKILFITSYRISYHDICLISEWKRSLVESFLTFQHQRVISMDRGPAVTTHSTAPITDTVYFL